MRRHATYGPSGSTETRETCNVCSSSDDLRPVFLRFGFGRTRTKWYGPQPVCKDCRKNKSGHWKKAPGFDPPKPPKQPPKCEAMGI